jgi:formylglycine-generating enzyme
MKAFLFNPSNQFKDKINVRAFALLILPLFLLVGCGEEIQSYVEQAKAKAAYEKLGDKFTIPNLNLEMIWVEPGTFTMGQHGVVGPEHNVTLSQGFYLGKYEVTQAQYEAVMTGNNDNHNPTPSNFAGNPNHPVERVNFDAVLKFIEILNQKEADQLPLGWSFTLPTDAEWEYACRAGTRSSFSWGEEVGPNDANWDHGNDANKTVDVGSYYPNAWGFYDMHGNLWEWTADSHTKLSDEPQTDPFFDGDTGKKVVRGGAYDAPSGNLRSSIRGRHNPAQAFTNTGFRLSLKYTNTPPL